MVRIGLRHCASCGHTLASHPDGGRCRLEACCSCEGWDGRWLGEPSEPDAVDSRVFRGHRAKDGTACAFLVNRYDDGRLAWEHPLSPRADLAGHSPTGFEWGYHGSGPTQLALAILAQVLSDEDALRHRVAFRCEFIAGIPRGDSWEIEEVAVVDWWQRTLAEENAR